MRLALIFGAAAGIALSQGIITTAIGTDPVFQDSGRPATQAGIGRSEGVVVGPDGTVYFSDYDNNQIFKVGTDGIIRVAAGNGLNTFSGDGGLATGASLSLPLRLAVDANGNLYFADARNSRIRKVTPDGIITTVAGGILGSGGDGGPAIKAGFNNPRGIALDKLGNLYIADSGNSRIRKVGTDGIIRTIAGTTAGFSGDGAPATSAQINFPYSVAVDALGNVYFTDNNNSRIRKIGLDGNISTVLSQAAASLQVTADGNLLVAQSTRVLMVSPVGVVTTVAGTGIGGFSGDGGKATAAGLSVVLDVAPGPGGSFYISDSNNYRIRAVDAGGIISTLAGTGQFRASPEGAPANTVLLKNPGGMKFDGAGNLYFTESSVHRVRRMAPDGTVFSFAGTSRNGGFTDGTVATQASLNGPTDVAVDSGGTVYIANTFAANIVRVDTQGKIFRFAGGGNSTADGVPATTAALGQSQGVAVDSNGVVYIAETQNHRIRKVTKDGLITTIAGTGTAGFTADGPALQAALNVPRGMALDSSGNLYIADAFNQRVRKLTPAGQISTFAGNGVNGFPKEGVLANTTSITNPSALSFDAAGNLYVTGSTQVYRIDLNGIINAVAGSTTAGFSGDGGPALLAKLSGVQGVAVDSSRNIYIADGNNDRIRVVLAAPPTFNASPTALSFTGAAGGTLTSAQTLSISSTAPGGAFSITNNLPTWLSVTPLTGTLPSAVQVVADPSKLTPGTYTQTLTLNVPNSVPATRTVAVTFTVTSAAPPKLLVTDTDLAFSFGAQSSASTRNVAVSNSGGGSLAFTATSATTSGGAWLSVSPASGIATPGVPVLIAVRANPGTLAPGVYLGTVTIVSAATNDRAVIAVTMTVNAQRQSIQLSQSGLTFTGVANGGFVLPQNFAVLNTGQGVMNWTANATTLSGGAWLAVSPASGATDASSNVVPTVQVSVNAASLPMGTYYGRVVVAASAADNSPQMVSVVLNVLPAGTNPGPQVQPTSLIFTGAVGTNSPSSQNILLGNPEGKSLAYVSGRLTLDGADWFFVAPPTGTVPTDQAATILVQPVIDNLTAGARRGVLTLLFTDGSVRTVSILLVLTPGGAGSSPTREAGGCTPTKLLPLLSSIGQDFNIPVAWPTALVTKVVDDCGTPMLSGSVTASFSNGDIPLSLISLKDGSWSATWQPRNSNIAQASIAITAQIPEQNLQGNISIAGSLQKNPDPPQVNAGGVVSAASFGQVGVIAPGSFISIYGTRFADGLNIAPGYPWGTELVGTEVILGGRSLPLYFTSGGQINAVVPIDVPPNSRQQLIVRRGFTYTVPETVSVAASQPAVFTPNQRGNGQGYVLVSAAGIETLADTKNPAKAGDAVVVYCAGLGVTNPAVADGTPASITALTPTVNPVIISIGGKDINPFFAGLAPGFIGLYQVNAVLPTGITAGDAVPVVLTVGGQSSPVVTMAVK